MSSFHSYWQGPDKDTSSGGSWFEALVYEFPEIAHALLGKFEPENGHCIIQRMTVMLFADGDKLKACLSPKNGKECWFTTIDDPSKPLESLEANLKAGRGERKSTNRR